MTTTERIMGCAVVALALGVCFNAFFWPAYALAHGDWIGMAIVYPVVVPLFVLVSSMVVDELR